MLAAVDSYSLKLLDLDAVRDFAAFFKWVIPSPFGYGYMYESLLPPSML